MSRNITVLGAGAWGTALASAMVKARHKVTLWGRNKEILDEIRQKRRNSTYLNDIKLINGIETQADIAKAVSGSDIILLVIPTQTIAAMIDVLKDIVLPDHVIITCAKGIDQNSGKTPAELLRGLVKQENIGVLSGPSFAHDVACDLPTAVTLAFENISQAMKYAHMLSSGYFRIYGSDDVVGVELGGALKNVLALAVGIVRGLGLGASAEAALIARGFGELRKLAEKMGAKADTLTGLSGLGDLVLTASSTQSRNFSYGMTLGRGDSVAGLPLAEGVFTAQIAGKLARDNGIDTPVIQSVGAILANRISARDAVRQLLSRPLKVENE
jgi:glycerol-3-phosphate dehydrogenase (NAD(P)+)